MLIKMTHLVVAQPLSVFEDLLTGLECFYVLSFAERNHREGIFNPWSSRQAFIYQRRAIPSLGALLFVTSSSDFPVRHLSWYLNGNQGNELINTVELHILLLLEAASTWRAYLVYIAEEVQQSVRSTRLVQPSKLISRPLTLGSLTWGIEKLSSVKMKISC